MTPENIDNLISSVTGAAIIIAIIYFASKS